MTGNRKTEAALLEWVNTFPLDTEVESPSDLSDGFVLNQILRDFDPQYYVENLEKNIGPSKWLSKKQSLERVYKSLLRYIRNHCDGLENITLENTVDFSAIAEHDDTEELVKLLTIMLMAAVTSNAEKYVLKIQDLKGAEEMMYIIQKMTELGKQSTEINSTSWDDAKLPSTLIKDAELAAEEERAALESQYSKLKKNYADHISRFERLQDNYDVLLQKHEVAETELQNLRESQRGDMGDYVRQLELEIRSKEDLIASQENKIEDDRRIIDNHKRSLKELGNASDQLLTLQDEVTELKIENGKLSKKANMVDNFQRKLESQASIEKENAKLRQQNETYEENMKEYDQTYSQNTKMKATIEEYRKKFSEYENEVVMLSGQKKSLQLTVEERDSRIERYMKQQEHDENFIAELQSQLQTGGIPSDFPQTPTAPSGGLLTLEQELDESRSNTNYALENSRLLAENQLLKDNTAGTTNATLRNELLEAEEKYKRLEQRFNQLTEDHAIGQEQLAAIISTSGDKHEAVTNTRRLYLEANKERDSLKRKVAELTSDITSRDRDIVTAKGDLKALGEDELHSLEELKATHQLITSSYQNDLLMLQKQHKILTEENEQQKSHLVEALLAKDKLRQELANSRDGQPAEPTGKGSDAAAASKSKSELEALKEKTEKQQSALLELQRRLKAAEENSADGQKAMIKNVLRENALMSTAWYDLSSRLQSNHVVLQRRQEAPKSWLNKQRQMVNATPRR